MKEPHRQDWSVGTYCSLLKFPRKRFCLDLGNLAEKSEIIERGFLSDFSKSICLSATNLNLENPIWAILRKLTTLCATSVVYSYAYTFYSVWERSEICLKSYVKLEPIGTTLVFRLSVEMPPKKFRISILKQFDINYTIRNHVQQTAQGVSD